MSFKIASSPHIQTHARTADIMKKVILCALPGLLAQAYVFGYGTALQVLLCIFSCVAGEALMLKARQQKLMFHLSDYTAVVTGLLLGLALPAYAPWWIAVLGSLFCSIVVKQLYGGLGNNIFNPAMMGYVFLLISFPAMMTQWPLPASLAATPSTLSTALQTIFLEDQTWILMRQSYDGVTMATPLDTLKTDLSRNILASESMASPLFDKLSGVGWSLINMAYLVGGVIMLRLNIICWHIPCAMLASLGSCALLGFLLQPEQAPAPWFHLFSGATMLGAFFIATDPVSTCTSIKGRLLFGCIIGVLIYTIRTFGGYPDGVAFAVVLANLCVPLIDHFIHPTTYGYQR